MAIRPVFPDTFASESEYFFRGGEILKNSDLLVAKVKVIRIKPPGPTAKFLSN